MTIDPLKLRQAISTQWQTVNSKKGKTMHTLDGLAPLSSGNCPMQFHWRAGGRKGI
jgi:hypothetical protein